VARAACLLRDGGLVAFPTETVYGLGARADFPEAVDDLFRVKQRPPERKLTVLIGDPGELSRYAAPCPVGHALAWEFWPGPLTLVLPDGRGGDVGLRCPDCAVTLALLRLAGVPVVAPSANISDRPPATDAEQVFGAFDGLIAAVLDGGRVRIGTPSTVARVMDGGIEVIRHGAIAEGDLRAAALKVSGGS